MGNNPISEGTPYTLDGGKVRFTLPSPYREQFESGLPQDEQDRDDYYLRAALDYIGANPGQYALLTAKRLWYFIWFDPTHHFTGHAVYRVPYIVVLLLSVIAVVRLVRSRGTDPFMIVTYLGFAVLYVPVISLPRYRIVPVAILLLLAAYALARWLPPGGRKTAIAPAGGD
ncbi:hypothetical protein KJ815_07885, partial [bacterium]|nr:hypothetical protein [bacterium]